MAGGTDAIAVTGLGLVTPAGIGVEENWERVLTGRSCATRDDTLGGLSADFSCRVPGFDAQESLGGFASWQLERFVQLALVASRMAVRDAGLDPERWDGTRVGVVLGNSLGGAATLEEQYRTLSEDGPARVSPLLVTKYMPNMLAGYVAIDCGARGPSLVTATACASGATAVGTARDLLRSGSCDIVLAGAAESALTPTVMAGLCRMGALSKSGEAPEHAGKPFDAERDGFVAAEAAGVLVLERAADARARGARIRSLVSGYAASSDAHHATAPAPDGEGIERALRAALADAGAAPSEVRHVNAHGTATPMNDLVEGTMLGRVVGRAAAVTSTKGVTGHALAAAGAIEAAYTVLAVQHGVVPPTANLKNPDPALELDLVAGEPRRARVDVAVSTSLGFGGHNAALVFTAA
ncbi:beta-ketoacyl-[acyl-carrier-protein] synthase family protein [Streptomyces sp. DH41]|uniref:beta-ketoacyl-[acyl-carrier-protein] synthase family protein n=1 Tax=Streptomyces sp. DH41 TaxID=3040125 RepID=UPI002442FB9B|nr:beta-ketoacyl-[acyl-carrier-protein] synthase family protein [Streptomyces sp. DH41]MDG9722701.1 beta-ketoacyl-[acyl-carrier-protein] synthase family protein [Streptomyces sp. DH41]